MTATSYLVVGAGVFGASTALSLLQAGHAVTVLERDGQGFAAKDSASHDLNKIVRSCYEDAHYAALAREAVAKWSSDPLYRPFYHPVGVLALSDRENARGVQYLRKSFESDFPDAPKDDPGPEAGDERPRLFSDPASFRRHLAPHVSHGSFEAKTGYFNPQGGWAEAANAVVAVMRRVKELGGTVVGGKTVASLVWSEREEGSDRTVRGVRTSDGQTYEADVTILAVGAWLPSLLASLLSDPLRPLTPLALPTVATAQCVATIQLDEAEARAYRGSPVVLDFGTGGYLFEPNAEGKIKVAIHGNGWINPVPVDGAEGVVLSKPISHPSMRPGVEDTAPESIPVEALRQIRATLASAYPDLPRDKPFEGTRVCWYCDTLDGNWVMDWVPGTKGLVTIGGGSGHAYKFLPLLGSLALSLLQSTLPAHWKRYWSWSHHVQLASDVESGRTDGLAGDGSRDEVRMADRRLLGQAPRVTPEDLKARGAHD